MRNKIITIYSILALLAIIAAVGAGLWCQKNSNSGSIVAVDKDVDITEETTSGEIIPTEKTDCVDELDTACWNTYVNKEYGFSFKYPEGWEAKNCFYDRVNILVTNESSLDCNTPWNLLNSNRVFSILEDVKLDHNIKAIQSQNWIDYIEKEVYVGRNKFFRIGTVNYADRSTESKNYENKYLHYFSNYIPFGSGYLNISTYTYSQEQKFSESRLPEEFLIFLQSFDFLEQ